jgi:putative oxidoreductase
MNPVLEEGASWGLLFLRLGVGMVFLMHGYPKMTGRSNDPKVNREGLTRSIRRLGLPLPSHLALSVGTLELTGGLMLIVGLWTRWAALALAMIMAVASARNFVEKGFLGSADFPLSLLATLLGLTFLGGGLISLDRLLFG